MLKQSDEVDSFLNSLLESSPDNTNQPSQLSTEKYKLPVRVGINGKPIDKGDKPWLVGHFAPGQYLNDTHPQGHDGVDLKAAPGTPIYPIASGIVTEVGQYPKGGLICKVSHENGQVVSYYAHMSKVNVQMQQEVKQNTILGIIGQTGNAKGRGEHLHYEVKVLGQKINPMSIVNKDVGSLSKKKQSDWDNIFKEFIKDASLFKVPDDLVEKIANYAIGYFAVEHIKYIDDKLELLSFKNDIEEVKTLIKNMPEDDFKESIMNNTMDLKYHKIIKNNGKELLIIYWDIVPQSKNEINEQNIKYDNITFYVLFLNKKIYFNEGGFDIEHWTAKQYYKEFYSKLKKVLKNIDYYEDEKIELILSKKYLDNFTKYLDNNLKIFDIDNNNCIKVTILRKTDDLNYAGLYRGYEFDPITKKNIHSIEITVKLPKTNSFDNIDSLKTEIHNIKTTVRHEIQHVFQRYLKYKNYLPNIVGLSGKKERSRSYDTFGIKSKNKLDQNIDYELDSELSRQDHALRDVEYQTRLSDSIDEFNSLYKNYPENLKIKQAKEWVGYTNYFADDFFEKLKTNYPKRWKKAIKEFWKAIFNDEITLENIDKKSNLNEINIKNAGLIKIPQDLLNPIQEFVLNQYCLIISQSIDLIFYDKTLSSELNVVEKNDLQEINEECKQYIKSTIEINKKQFIYKDIKLNILFRRGDLTTDRAIYIYKAPRDGEDYLIISYYTPSTLNSFKVEIEKLKSAIEHELQHFLQFNHDVNFGLPPKNIRNNLDIKYRLDEINNDYNIDDYEFYPLLKSSFDMFIIESKKFNKEQLQDLAKDWVGAGNNNLIDTNEFFKELQNREPEKWKKAIKEFFKVFNFQLKNNKLEKNAGLVKIPQYLLDNICNYVFSNFAQILINKINNNIDIVEKTLLLNYANKISELDFDKELSKFFNYGKERINVKLFENHNKSSGMYTLPFKGIHEIEIYLIKPKLINSLQEFKDELIELKRIIGHELTHVLQEYYKNQYKINTLYGLPSKNIKEKDKTPDGFSIFDKYQLNAQLPHGLRDVEFYTNLKDAIFVFKQKYDNLPEAIKEEAARVWVGLKPRTNHNINKYLEYSNWFNFIISKPEKWKKAVKEFWKAVFGDEIKFIEQNQINKLANQKTAGLLKVPQPLIESIKKYVFANFAANVIEDLEQSTVKYKMPDNIYLPLKRKCLEFFDDSLIGDEKLFNFEGQKIHVKLKFIENNIFGMQSFNPLTNEHEIEIYLYKNWLSDHYSPTEENFNKELNNLSRAISHEIGHVVQRLYHAQENKIRFGLPPIKTRNKDANPDGILYNNKNLRKVHELRDVEFYTRLGDSISLFKEKYSNLSKENLKDAVKCWIGVTSYEDCNFNHSLNFNFDEWFIFLKKNEFEKWKKACKEFIKNIDLSEVKRRPMTLKEFLDTLE